MKNGILRIINDLVLDEEKRGARKKEGRGGRRDEEEQGGRRDGEEGGTERKEGPADGLTLL